MSIQQSVLDNLSQLSIDKQKTVLEFIKFLKYQQENEPTPKFNFKGLWADFNITITEDDLTIARQEMWGNLGREIEL